MVKVLGVKIEGNGRIYNCLVEQKISSAELRVKTPIICRQKGVDFFAEIDRTAMDMPERYLRGNYYTFVRLATAEDQKQQADKVLFEKEALHFAAVNAERLEMDMHFLQTHLSAADNKFIFYFEAPERLDFRELVKCLAYRYHMRIELRQVGAREKAKIKGGIGVCGQVACCVRHLEAFPQVTIKMAKEQNLAINSSKSQGSCGRLLCCLQYEQNWYDEASVRLPHLGYTLNTVYGKGVVKSVNLQREIVQVRLDSAKDSDPWQVVSIDEIKDKSYMLAVKEAEKLQKAALAQVQENKSSQPAERERNNSKPASCCCRTDKAQPCCAHKRENNESVYLAGKSYSVVQVYQGNEY